MTSLLSEFCLLCLCFVVTQYDAALFAVNVLCDRVHQWTKGRLIGVQLSLDGWCSMDLPLR